MQRKVRPSLLGALLLVGLTMAWKLAELGNVQTVQAMAVAGMFGTVAWAIIGPTVCRACVPGPRLPPSPFYGSPAFHYPVYGIAVYSGLGGVV